MKRAVLGGTFDIIHKGHAALLKKAYSVADEVWIGVTSDAYVKKHKSKYKIRPARERVSNLRKFLRQSGVLSRTKIILIDSNEASPAANEKSFDYLVCSRKTRKGAVEINNFRKKRGLKQLKIIAIPLVYFKREPISSTALREEILAQRIS